MELTALQASLVSSPAGRATPTPVPPAASPAPRGQATASGAATTGNPIDKAELAQAVEQLSKAVESLSAEGKRRLHFHLDEDSGAVVAKVLEGGSERVLRQIPSEEFLDVAARLRELGSFLMDEIG